MVLNLFLKSLDLLQASGNNDQTMACGLYIEYAASVSEVAAAKLEEEPHLFLKVLRDMFFLMGLPAQQVGRFLELRYPSFYSSQSSSFVGERARWQLAEMLRISRDANKFDFEEALRKLAEEVGNQLHKRAAQLLGKTKSAWLLSRVPPGMKTWSDHQVIEHLLCEAYKISNPETGTLRNDQEGMSDASYQSLLRAAFPDYSFPLD